MALPNSKEMRARTLLFLEYKFIFNEVNLHIYEDILSQVKFMVTEEILIYV